MENEGDWIGGPSRDQTHFIIFFCQCVILYGCNSGGVEWCLDPIVRPEFDSWNK